MISFSNLQQNYETFVVIPEIEVCLYLNLLQNYYCLAIRQNCRRTEDAETNAYQMRMAVSAIPRHFTDNPDEELRHNSCPHGARSWCKYQSDQITGKKTYKPRNLMNRAVAEELTNMFSYRDLANPELLNKCTHGLTQNANESFNNVIWRRCPKTIYVERETLVHSVSSAVVEFNEGQKGLLDVFRKLGFAPGNLMTDYVNASDAARMQQMDNKCTDEYIDSCIRLRGIRRGWADKNREAKGGEAFKKGNLS